MSQDQRIYNGQGRDLVSQFHDEKLPAAEQTATTFARQRLYQAITALVQAGYEMSDVQAYVMRQTVDATRDIVTYGLPEGDIRKLVG